MGRNKRKIAILGLIVALLVIIVIAGKIYVDGNKASHVAAIEATRANHTIIGYTQAEQDALIAIAEDRFNGRAQIIAGKTDKGSSIVLKVTSTLDDQRDIRDGALSFVSVARELSAKIPSDYYSIWFQDGTKQLRFELTSAELSALNTDAMRSLFDAGDYKAALEVVNYKPSVEVSKLID